METIDIEVTYEPIIRILEDILGECCSHNEFNGQLAFDCPVCSHEIKGLDHGDGKGNLEVNYYNNAYNCWACGETHETHGNIYGLILKFGNKSQLKKYKILNPDVDSTHKKKKDNYVSLPKEFIPFNNVSTGLKLTHFYKQAINYIRSRNITDDMVDKFNIGFCYDGFFKNRIIIPSYNKKEELNYFIARSYEQKPEIKYRNPNIEKDIIIFNEHLINWNKDIYLVEGAFDSIFINNSIPLLGKKLSDYLFDILYKKVKKDIIIILDPDAIADAENIYYKLNGGKLYGRVWVVKLDGDDDIADLCGDLSNYRKEKLK